MSTIKSAMQLAEEIRTDLWSPHSFPVDPVTIAQKLGINVIETELPDTVSGAIIKEIDKDAQIVLHYADSNNRKRFSCAHELGHFLDRLQKNDAHAEYEYIDLRGHKASCGSDPDEIFANQFAANLLMPLAEVTRFHHAGKSIAVMASFFGVSPQAMSYRLSNLGIN